MGKKGKRSKKKDAWREAEKSESLMIYILLDILNFRVLYSKPNYCLSNTQLPSSVIRESDKLMDVATEDLEDELFSKQEYQRISIYSELCKKFHIRALFIAAVNDKYVHIMSTHIATSFFWRGFFHSLHIHGDSYFY